MTKIAKKRCPLRKIVSREQSFKSTEDYPDGWINETLECGHVFQNPIERGDRSLGETLSGSPLLYRNQVSARRCVDCAKEQPPVGGVTRAML